MIKKKLSHIFARGKPRIKKRLLTAITLLSFVCSIFEPAIITKADTSCTEAFLNANYYSYDVYVYNVPTTA